MNRKSFMIIMQENVHTQELSSNMNIIQIVHD